MTKGHRIDSEINMTTRPVKGQPRVREVVGCYRPFAELDGPFVLDDGPKGGRETPRMTKPIPLTKASKSPDRRYKSSSSTKD